MADIEKEELLDSEHETDTDTEISDEEMEETLGQDESQDEADEDESENETPKYTEHEKKLFARLKKAEAKLKELEKSSGQKAKKQIKNNVETTDDFITRSEAILLAKGFEDEDIDVAKSIAKGYNISLAEAVKHKVFTAYKTEKDSEIKKQKASLGASQGSGSSKKSGIKPGMTEEEHKAFFNKAIGR